MKKNTLYTVNKWNSPALGGKLYAKGGLLAEAQAYKSQNPWDFADDKSLIGQYVQTDAYKQGKGGLFNMTRESNPFSRGNINGTMSGLATIGSPLITNAISGGYSTGGVGGGISTVGNAIGDALPEGPWKWGVKLGSAVVGGVVNRGWGVKKNEKNIGTIEQNTSDLRNAGNALASTGTSNDFFDAAGRMSSSSGFGTTDLVKGGWFSKKKARKQGQKYINAENNALAFQNNAMMTGAGTVDSNLDSSVMSNFAAFGGPIDTLTNNDDMSAINYGFMSDYLTQKKLQNEAKNKIAGISPMPALNAFAEGGGIEIKHPGRLTRLKERTGKTEAELWAEGKPEVRKMITFARNARKWKKAYGGYIEAANNLFALGGPDDPPVGTTIYRSVYDPNNPQAGTVRTKEFIPMQPKTTEPWEPVANINKDYVPKYGGIYGAIPLGMSKEDGEYYQKVLHDYADYPITTYSYGYKKGAYQPYRDDYELMNVHNYPNGALGYDIRNAQGTTQYIPTKDGRWFRMTQATGEMGEPTGEYIDTLPEFDFNKYTLKSTDGENYIGNPNLHALGGDKDDDEDLENLMFYLSQKEKYPNGRKKTEAELYNDGNPAHKKMVVFARNSRRWKKAYGGLIDAIDKIDTIEKNLFPYGGGTFSGSGAGGSWEDTKDTYPEVKDFNEAFDKAVKAGLPEFLFQGRRYNTKKEHNPVREYNNRWVGAGRRSDVKNPSESYDHQAGPLGGPMSLIPMVTDTHVGSPERPPQLDYNPNAFDRVYSFGHYYDKPKKISPKKSYGGPLFALGGVLQSHGSDWTNGTMHIDAGGSHESNPYEGIQIGKDESGTPNLVEEGERIFNDYVYSKRIFADGGTLKKFHLSKKRKISFADLAELLEKESKERPNDPISQAALRVQMQDLADEQERQKQEMEAQRAREAFEALSPEEQTALMQQAAQQEQMAQQQAIQEQATMEQQQPSPEEMAMAEQQQMMQVDGSEAMVGQEPQINAYGGKVNKYPWGGITNLFNITPPYAASRTAGFIPYTRDLTEEEVLKREQDPTFQAWTNYVNSYWDNPNLDTNSRSQIENYLRALDTAAGGNHLFDTSGNILPSARDYYNHARTGNHKWGYYHLTPEQLAANKIYHAVEGDDDYLPEDQTKWNGVGAEMRREALPNGDTVIYHDRITPSGNVFHAMDGDLYDGYIEGQLDPNKVGAEVRRETLPNGDVVIYHAVADGKPNTPNEADKTKGTGSTDDEWEVTPNYRNDKLRYAGLFGPAVGLGMQALGIGRPNTKGLEGVLDAYDKQGAATADYQPIGNYLKYRPMDIWYEQNRMDANARATDRALQNNASPIGNRMAGLLASGYNSQTADGQLYRQALEYNDALRKQTADFNRGTDMFNAEAYNRTALQNAEVRNRDRQLRANLGMQAAQAKMNADAGWYNGIYGNVAGLFKGIGDLGRENAQHNMIAEMAADGIFGPLSPRTNTGRRDGYLTFTKKSAAKGGKINKKKG